MEDRVFPMISIKIRNNEINMRTKVRNLHTDGKWYKVLFSKTVRFSDPDDVQDLLSIFLTEIYTRILIGKVDLKAIDDQTRGEIFELDENQNSEIERVTNAFKTS